MVHFSGNESQNVYIIMKIYLNAYETISKYVDEPAVQSVCYSTADMDRIFRKKIVCFTE